jgi:hypothetical protein
MVNRRIDGVGGRVAEANRWIEQHPPPGPYRRVFWRSPLRGPWLTAFLGMLLLGGLTVMIVTGLLSYAAYDPVLDGNDFTPGKGFLGFYLFEWPTSPSLETGGAFRRVNLSVAQSHAEKSLLALLVNGEPPGSRGRSTVRGET